jgi:hypothetical protein
MNHGFNENCLPDTRVVVAVDAMQMWLRAAVETRAKQASVTGIAHAAPFLTELPPNLYLFK